MTERLTAFAAVVAAAFSVVNFYWAERRESQKWRREALLDTYHAYLTLSRGRDHVADRAARLKMGVTPNSELPQELEDREARLHEEQLDALTRLRLLAAREIVAAAERLHVADHLLLDSAKAVRTDEDVDGYMIQARSANKDAKRDLLNAVRSSLGLPRDSAFDPDL